MSDLLRLTARLRNESDARLVELIQQRQVNTSSMRDLFDLGEQLLSTRNLQATISSLPARKLDVLDALDAGIPLDASNRDVADLAGLQLIFEDAGVWRAYDAVVEALASLRESKAKPKQKPSLVVASEQRDLANFSLTRGDTRAALSQDEIDRDCGIAMFETTQAITELLFLLKQHFVREVGRGNMGLPDLKRLAGRIGKTTDYSRDIVELAAMAGVIELTDGRWQGGYEADAWMTATPIERWLLLAEGWLAALGPVAQSELLGAFEGLGSGTQLDEVLAAIYPLADASTSANIRRTVARGNLIGLTDAGLVASWTPQLLGGNTSHCIDAVATRMPNPIDRLIVQADLSLIAPGPLTTQTEVLIREFADCEQIGFASTYRVSALSITLGLERGHSVGEIRDLLVGLSGKALPQPVEYLLRESEERFGRLVVHNASVPDHSVVTSSDPILLRAILGDPAMKPFGLLMTNEGDLACKFEAEILYFGLREAGYAAIRARSGDFDSFEQLEGFDQFAGARKSSPRMAAMQIDSEPRSSGPLSDIARMREQDSKPGLNPDTDDVMRQIQLAIKNRVRLNITVTGSNGDTHDFLLEPTGIANGRLRAKDRKADIERTLPLASITAVTLA